MPPAANARLRQAMLGVSPCSADAELRCHVCEVRPTGVATMTSISRRICGVLVGLGVLGLIVPVVRADEMADWMADMQRQNEEFNRKAQEDREALDRFNREAQ